MRDNAIKLLLERTIHQLAGSTDYRRKLGKAGAVSFSAQAYTQRGYCSGLQETAPAFQIGGGEWTPSGWVLQSDDLDELHFTLATLELTRRIDGGRSSGSEGSI